jgi:cobalt/nickel transport system permease protein
MHIPDGFLDLKTAAASGLCAAAGLGWALSKARKELPPRRVPLLGLGAAFLFAAQMVNFPVIGGTSGHLIGGALIGVLLGIPGAVIVMSSVLLAQCFLFADGGVTALGANIFNMGVVAPAVGASIFQLVTKTKPTLRTRVAAMAFAGWCSTVAASFACAGQLAWSGLVAWSVALPAMVGVHALIGFGEGLISALIYYAVARHRPALLDAADPQPAVRFLVPCLLAALGIALFVAPFACPWPDGLDSLATKLGFEHRAQANSLSLFEQYSIPGIHSAALSTALAGAIGLAVAFIFSTVISRFLVRENTPEQKSQP